MAGRQQMAASTWVLSSSGRKTWVRVRTTLYGNDLVNMSPKIAYANAGNRRSALEDAASPPGRDPSASTIQVLDGKAKQNLRSTKGRKARPAASEDWSLPSVQLDAGVTHSDTCQREDRHGQSMPGKIGLDSSESSCSSDVELLPLHQRLQLRGRTCQATPAPPDGEEQVHHLLHTPNLQPVLVFCHTLLISALIRIPGCH